MTKAQIQYRLNAKKSKRLCREMEILIEEIDYLEKSVNFDSLEIAVYRLEQVRADLDIIWAEQVDLYDRVLREHRVKTVTALTKAVSNQKNKKSF